MFHCRQARLLEQYCPGSLFRLHQVSSAPWHFKSDDSLSPRGNVEKCHCGPCLHPDYLLLAMECSSKYMDLAICVLGRLI